METAYRIADVADRTGFSASTLRYYEQIGLLPAPERTPHGYRVFGPDIFDRLAFVARAKRLGCTLGEIADLLAARDSDQCEPLQTRLRELVSAKIASAQRRATEIATFTAELRHAAAALAAHTPDGPCDDRCGCAAQPRNDVACTLTPEDMRTRLTDWDQALAQVVAREPIDGGTRVTFGAAADVGAIAELAAKEQDCCRFFRFAITVDERGVALEIRAPAEGQPVIAALFGT